jgi:hypothetical protein
MKKALYFSVLLVSLTGLFGCNSRTDSTLVMPTLTGNYAVNDTQKENPTASQIYLKTKDEAKKWSKDAILTNIFSNLEGPWNIYYYSKGKGMFLIYSNITNTYNEEKLNAPDLPLFLKAPYREIENWKIDSNKALALSGKNSYLDMYMEYNQVSKKMEWHISFFSSVYVDIDTGAVRN